MSKRNRNHRRDDAHCHTASYSFDELDPISRLFAVRARRDGWQDGAQPGGRGATPPHVGGAPARPPPLARGGIPGGGGVLSTFDARKASPEQMARKLALLPGIDMSYTVNEFANRRKGTTVNELALQLDEAVEGKRDRKLRASREKASQQIDEARKSGTAWNAMAGDVSVDEVRAHLAEMEIRDPVVLDTFFKRHGKALERKAEPPSPAFSQAVRQAKAASVAEAAKLDPAAFFEWLRQHGISPATSWPVTR